MTKLMMTLFQSVFLILSFFLLSYIRAFLILPQNKLTQGNIFWKCDEEIHSSRSVRAKFPFRSSYIKVDESKIKSEDEISYLNPDSTNKRSLSLTKGVEFPTNLNGSEIRIGIIMTRWNSDVIQRLHQGVNESLVACGVRSSNVFFTYVPGAFEIPVTAKLLTASKRFDVIICLGCLIKGETMHFEYIAQATASGIMQVSLETLVPCVFGVLTVLNKEQAIKRSTGEANEGISWGRTAVEMGLARMSALGMNPSKKEKKQSSRFVTFNSELDSRTIQNTTQRNSAQKLGF